jgi:hypothetical protein
MARPLAPEQTRSKMSEYRPCEYPYHDDGDGFIGGDDCPNEGRIKTAPYGWLCAECYDQLEAAWKSGLEHRDELVVVDRDGDRIA